MNLSLKIALRYLFARKSQNLINVISLISLAGILVGTVGLLVVLSVFNGLQGLIGSLYGNFDPDLKIEPAHGKVFSVDSIDYSALVSIHDVEAVTKVVEDHVLFRFRDRQAPGRVMGVDSGFNRVSGIESIIVDGHYAIKEGATYHAVLGAILADQLAVNPNVVAPLMIYAPERSRRINPARPDQAFRSQYINPAGVFMVNQVDVDATYSIIEINQARDLLGLSISEVSWIGINVSNERRVAEVQNSISTKLGNGFTVRNREQQHETFFRMMRVEKLIAYLILSFILMIAVFNIIGTLSMLIFEKRDNINTLRSMGANRMLINRVFIIEGWLISLGGVVGGLIIGALLVWLQQTFGLIRFQGAGAFIVEAYPVILRATDIGLVFLTVSATGLLASWYPVKIIVQRYYPAQGKR